jgi:hypothetical protein
MLSCNPSNIWENVKIKMYLCCLIGFVIKFLTSVPVLEQHRLCAFKINDVATYRRPYHGF